MKYLILLLLPLCAHAANVSLSTGGNCTFISASVDSSGNAFYNCGGIPAPVPTPTPTPTPPAPIPAPPGSCVNSAGEAIAPPANMVMQTMYIGGTNNYVFDSLRFVNPGRGIRFNGDTRGGPDNTVQVFPIPKTWVTGQPATHGSISFVEVSGFYGVNSQFEISLSKCPGDFSYYKSQVAQVTFFGSVFEVCGMVLTADNGVSFGPEAAMGVCAIPPNEQWYLNWRIVPGTCSNLGHNCGQIFTIPYAP